MNSDLDINLIRSILYAENIEDINENELRVCFENRKMLVSKNRLRINFSIFIKDMI